LKRLENQTDNLTSFVIYLLDDLPKYLIQFTFLQLLY